MAKSVPGWQITAKVREAAAHLAAGRQAEALALYEQALAVGPRDAGTLFTFGSLALRLGDAERAVTYLRQAVKRDPTVVEMSLAVLRRLNFVGAVKVDLKRDPTTGRYYVLEINPRFTLWSHLGAASGINLPLIAYAEQTDQAVSLQLAYSTGTRWLSFGNDFRAFVRSYRPTGLTTVAWLRSYLSPKVYDVFARDDWLPLLVTICRYIKGLLCRLLRGIRRMARPLDAGTRHASERVEATKLTTK